MMEMEQRRRKREKIAVKQRCVTGESGKRVLGRQRRRKDRESCWRTETVMEKERESFEKSDSDQRKGRKTQKEIQRMNTMKLEREKEKFWEGGYRRIQKKDLELLCVEEWEGIRI